MRYSVTILQDQWDSLSASIFELRGVEGAAYLLCGTSRYEDELRFLVREVIPVRPEDYVLREPFRLSIASPSYARIAKGAEAAGNAILFVHSHPYGHRGFSPQDDREDPKLHGFLAGRAAGPHGSLVVSREGESAPLDVVGRIWIDGSWVPVDRVRVLGKRFRFFDAADTGAAPPEIFDRQVRAFGPDIQRLLGSMHVGVVGAGGTGSAVVEQLIRLGVGRLSVFDGDAFDPTNVNRVYGSRTTDVGAAKVSLIVRSAEEIAVGTILHPVDRYIDEEDAARSLRGCDIVFGCTDDHTSRAILVRLAGRYLLPVFDTGIMIDSKDGTIRDVTGRVTLLLAGEACLFCRGRISAEAIALEGMTDGEREQRRRDGYAPELVTRAPAVIPFTTAVATQAVMELLHRLTGYMRAGEPSEVLLRLDSRDLRGNRSAPDPACSCAHRDVWGRGDEHPFLGRGWRPPRPPR